MFDFFLLPFMQKAFIAGLALGFLLPFLGVFVTLRKLSFFGDGIAHASLAGIAIGIIAGINPFPTALAAGLLTGAFVFFLERKTTIASDALIGALFPGALALGLVLMSIRKGYQPELFSFLFGNILSIRQSDFVLILLFSAIMIGILIVLFRQFALLAFDRETAWLYRVPAAALDFVFYMLVAGAIVLGVKLLGVILVSALLVIPPTMSKLLARSFKQIVIFSILSAEVCIIVGLTLSYIFDLPSGATIVLVGACSFLLLALIQTIFLPRRYV